jgi:hypothetical protein
LGAFLPQRSSKIDPSAKRNTTPTRQTKLPAKAQIIWTNVGGSKTLIRANPVTATIMVTTPPSFSSFSIYFNIFHLLAYVIQEIIVCSDNRRGSPEKIY